MKRYILNTALFGVLVLSEAIHGIQIAVEQFRYVPGTDLENRNGGTGFQGSWTASNCSITANSLTHPAVHNTAGNKATIIIPATVTEIGIRQLSTEATSQIHNALNSENGLWLRYLHNIPDAPRLGDAFSLLLGGESQGSSGIQIIKGSFPAGNPAYLLQIGNTYSNTVNAKSSLTDVDLVVANVHLLKDLEFNIKVWVLGQLDKTFDPSSEPLINFKSTLPGYSQNGNAYLSFSNSFNIDEIFVADTAHDLFTDPVPEPATCASMLIGGAYLLKRKRCKRLNKKASNS